jgi:hypothetical protein
MPQVRKLTEAEVKALNNKGKGQRKIVEEEYDAILSQYEAGDYGEALLEPGENRLTVRNRLKAAAKRRDLAVDFRRTKDDLLRFQVVGTSNGRAPSAQIVTVDTPVSSDIPPAPAKRKGGRRKKSA